MTNRAWCPECGWEGRDRDVRRVTKPDGQEEDVCPKCESPDVQFADSSRMPAEFWE